MISSADPKVTRVLRQAMEYALYAMLVGVSISNALTGIGVAVVLLLWTVKRFILRERASVPRPLVILEAILFLAYAASLLNSGYLGQSLRALFFKTGQYLLLVFAVVEGLKEKRVAINMALVLCGIATFICFDGFYQFVAGRDLLLFREAGWLDVFYGGKEFHSFRITATFPAANTLASYLAAALMLGLALTFFYGVQSRKIAWGKGICLGSMFLCLLLTFSRGGLIGFLAGVLVLAFLFKKKRLLALPIILAVVFLCAENIYGSRTPQEGMMDPTVQTRLLMLKDAARMFRSQPWTGIGLNTYYKNNEKNRSASLPASYAHNSYMQMIAEVGIVGFMAFVALLIYWFRSGFRAFWRLRDPELKFLLGGVLAGGVGLCVNAFFDNVFFSLLPATLFWIFFGYAVALTKMGSD